MLVARNETVAEILSELQKRANLDDDTVRETRIFEVHSGKLSKELRADTSVTLVNDYATLYAERIPAEELNLEGEDRVISAFNFDREPNRPHGVPFKFVVKQVSPRSSHPIIPVLQDTDIIQGEVFKQTKDRISKRTGIKGKPFEKIKFAVVPRASFSTPRYLEDGEYTSFSVVVYRVC